MKKYNEPDFVELSISEKIATDGGGEDIIIYEVFYLIGRGVRWFCDELKTYEPGPYSYTYGKIGTY